MKRALFLLLAALTCCQPAHAADPSLEDTKRFRWTSDGVGGLCVYFDRNDNKDQEENEPCFDGGAPVAAGAWTTVSKPTIETITSPVRLPATWAGPSATRWS